MKRKLWINSVILTGLLLVGVTEASAGSFLCLYDSTAPGCKPTQTGPTSPVSVPELDASSGTGAIALLAGVMLMLRERSGSKKN